MLKKIFGSNRDTGIVDRKGPRNEKRYDLYCSTNIILEMKPRRMRWAGHAACMGG